MLLKSDNRAISTAAAVASEALAFLRSFSPLPARDPMTAYVDLRAEAT
jgi:antirestriction protein ArdC